MSLLKRLQIERGKQEHSKKSEKAIDSIDSSVYQNSPANPKQNDSKAAELQVIKNRVHRKLVDYLEEEGLLNTEKEDEEIRGIISKFLDEEERTWIKQEKEQIIQELKADIKGFGPIEILLNDPDVSEVMVNSSTQIYVERKGKLEVAPVNFRDDQHVLRIIEKIVAPIGRRIDESSPMVDARLPDGSRVNAIIPPLALKGPCITIRKFSKDPLQIHDLIGFGTLTPEMARFMEAAVRARLNIVVSGGTGSGKTTTLNVLSSFIPDDERIVTIEDAAEIQLRQNHVITLETRPPNMEGKGAITMRDLVKNSLRMRPDRIVVGEVRSGEALDMLQAMNTGHDGSLTTGHANSPRDMIARLETMVLMAGMDLPIRAIRDQIASAVDLIIQQTRLKDGTRKITHITEVLGMEGDVITLQDIFVYEIRGKTNDGKVLGEFRPTGVVPKCLEAILSNGIPISTELFAR